MAKSMDLFKGTSVMVYCTSHGVRGNANGHGVAEAQGETLRGTWELGESEQGAGEFSAKRQKKERTAP
jgi:hypothetical protein